MSEIIDVIVAKVSVLELKDGDLVCITAPPNTFRPGEASVLIKLLEEHPDANAGKEIAFLVWPNELNFTIIRQGEVEEYKLKAEMVE